MLVLLSIRDFSRYPHPLCSLAESSCSINSRNNSTVEEKPIFCSSTLPPAKHHPSTTARPVLRGSRNCRFNSRIRHVIQARRRSIYYPRIAPIMIAFLATRATYNRPFSIFPTPRSEIFTGTKIILDRLLSVNQVSLKKGREEKGNRIGRGRFSFC